MKPQRRELLAEGISQKISPPLVCKPQIQALAREVFAERAKKDGSGWKKGEENSTVGYNSNEMQILYVWFVCVCVTIEEKKRKRWKMERNKHHWAGRPLVSFGELRLSTITAQSLSRNPELGKRKPGLSFPLFLQVLITFTQLLLPSSLCTSFCSFLFLVVLLCLVTSPWFVMCIIYSLDSAWTHLEALKAAQHCCINVFFVSLFGV